MSGIRRPQIVLMIATLALGLAVEVRTGLFGQVAVSAGTWGVLFYLLGRVARVERTALMTCLVIATAGELFLSLGWGLYTYRLGNVPLFVPPGHVMMFLLGMSLARRMPELAMQAIVGCAALYALAAAAAGADTLGIAMFLVLGIALLALPGERRLFASTFVLALCLELYGTWLGNWTWAREVPYTGLVTTNPPGVSGALYAALDALVAAASLAWAARRAHQAIAPPSIGITAPVMKLAAGEARSSASPLISSA